MGSILSIREQRLAGRARKSKRLFPEWVVIGVFCIATGAGTLRMVASIVDWYWLNFANVQPGPLYLAITGGLWGLLGLATLVWLGLRIRWWRIGTTFSAIWFAISYWLDRLLVRNPESSSTNLAFAVGCTLFILFYVILVLRPWSVAWPESKG